MLGNYNLRKENPVLVKFYLRVARGTSSVCILRHIDCSDVFGLFVGCMCSSVHKQHKLLQRNITHVHQAYQRTFEELGQLNDTDNARPLLSCYEYDEPCRLIVTAVKRSHRRAYKEREYHFKVLTSFTIYLTGCCWGRIQKWCYTKTVPHTISKGCQCHG